MLDISSYVEIKTLAQQHGMYLDMLEHDTHFSVSLMLHDTLYHRHILKGSAEATALLADFWPGATSMLFDYGNYTLGTNARSFANRKTIVMTAPQKPQTVTVASVTSNTITLTTNTVIRKALTAGAAAGGNQFTVASTANLWIGMRIKLAEAAKLDTETYIEKIVNSTIVQIAQSFLDTYTTSCTMYQDFTGRYILLKPTSSITRMRVVTQSNDTFTMNTMGQDITTILTANDSVRVTKEVCKLDQWMLSGTTDYLVVSELCMPMFYGDSLEHVMGRYLLRSKGELMQVPLVLDGDYGDYAIVRGYDLGNTSPQAFCTLGITVRA